MTVAFAVWAAPMFVVRAPLFRPVTMFAALHVAVTCPHFMYQWL